VVHIAKAPSPLGKPWGQHSRPRTEAKQHPNRRRCRRLSNSTWLRNQRPEHPCPGMSHNDFRNFIVFEDIPLRCIFLIIKKAFTHFYCRIHCLLPPARCSTRTCTGRYYLHYIVPLPLPSNILPGIFCYPGGIRPIFTRGAELWHGNHTDPMNLATMERIEYHALRKITGAYDGSSKINLAAIAGVEPLHTNLDHLSASWSARAIRTGGVHIRRLLEGVPPRDLTPWYDGTRFRGFKTDSPISATFYKSTIPERASISFGGRYSVGPVNIRQMELIASQDEWSKHRGYRAVLERTSTTIEFPAPPS